QAENESAGRGALTASAAGESVSEDLGAEPGSARWAAIAGASSQAGAGPGAHQEPAAGHGVEPGSAEKMEVVDETGTRRTGAVASVAVRSRAAPAVAGNAGRAGSGSGRVEPAGGGRSPKAAGGDAAADPSGSRSGDGVGHGADAGAGGALRLRQRGGQLLRTDSEGRFQRRKTAAGQDQQTGQFVSALFAGGSGTDGGTLRSAAETLLPPPGDA